MTWSPLRISSRIFCFGFIGFLLVSIVSLSYRLPPEKRSLRAYVSILYADPRMKVYIQSRKVQTKRLLDTLYASKRYNYASKTFRMRAERELAKAKEDVKVGMYLNFLSPYILSQVYCFLLLKFNVATVFWKPFEVYIRL